MADDTIRRLFDKLDGLSREIGELKVCLDARDREFEKQAEIIKDIDDRLTKVEASRNLFNGGVNTAAWIATLAVAVYSATR